MNGVKEAEKLGGTSIPKDKIRRSWEICSLMFPEQSKAWTVHANSPLVLSTVWATMSLFKTSAHVSQRVLALATFAVMTFSKSGNWFGTDAQAMLEDEGFNEEQAKAVLGLSFSLKMSEYMPLYCFEGKENAVLALAYHMVWYSASKAADGNTERADKVRLKVREKLAQEMTPLQMTELTWRISFCLALIWNNDFLIGTEIWQPPAKDLGGDEDVILDPQSRFRAATITNVSSPDVNRKVSAGGGRGVVKTRPRRTSVGSGRGRGTVVNPYSSSHESSPAGSPTLKNGLCITCDTEAKRTALVSVRKVSQCPFCKKHLK